jgi:uncharacterized protein (DUF779 family)
MYFPAGEFVVGDLDLLLGVIEDCPLYMDARIYRLRGDAGLVLDVATGDPEGFSLGPGHGLRFVTGPAARVSRMLSPAGLIIRVLPRTPGSEAGYGAHPGCD